MAFSFDHSAFFYAICQGNCLNLGPEVRRRNWFNSPEFMIIMMIIRELIFHWRNKFILGFPQILVTHKRIPELIDHFESIGSPIMIGGGVLGSLSDYFVTEAKVDTSYKAF